MKKTETVYAHGHGNIRATNRTTFEITKENALTERGDCIVAVGATKGASDLSPEFKEMAKHDVAQITITLETDDQKEIIRACGSPQLSFTHITDLVVRKSNYVCSRTLAILADKAAKDFSRELVGELRNSERIVKITLAVENAI